MRIRVVLLNLAVCLAVLPFRPAAARAACSPCSATPIYRGDPADGSDDVPLNKALVVEGVFVRDSVVLEDQAGERVAFTLNAGPTPGCPDTWAELIPKQPLAPHTKYTIRVTPKHQRSANDDERNYITFTTGTTMLADEALELPEGNASMVLNAPSSVAECGSTNALVCASVARGEKLEVVVRRGDREVLRWLVPEEVAREMTFGFEAAPDCVEFRQRAANGKRSAALKFCGDALNTREFRSSDSPGFGFTCHDGKFGGNASDDPIASGDEPMVQPSDDPSQGAAGSRAPTSDPMAAPPKAESAHRSDGCSTLPSTSDSHPPWLLMAAGLVFAARSGKRRRRGA